MRVEKNVRRPFRFAPEIESMEIRIAPSVYSAPCNSMSDVSIGSTSTTPAYTGPMSISTTVVVSS